MLSASQFTTCNFLIGKNFNTSRFPSPVADRLSLSTFKKLEISPTAPESITSKFLIDNSEHASCDVRRSSPPAHRLPAVARVAVGSRPAACSSLVTRHLSLFSNRPTPRLETAVSHRKQRIDPVSNRPNFTVIKFPVPRSRAESAPRSDQQVVGKHELERYFASDGIVRARRHDVSSLFFRRPSC